MRTNHAPLRAVLFDLDGTLINSVDHIVACWQHTVRACLGREMAREEILPTLGRALLECFEEVAPGRSEEMRVAYRAYQLQTHDTMITLFPGTRETLERLKSAGLELGVVTSKGLPVATEGLDLFNLLPFFNTLVTYEDTTRHKPHPDPLLTACERLGIEPDQALYVGDAVVDIQAGRAAGPQTAGVTWGAASREDIANAGPDYVFNSMDQLPPAITGQSKSRRLIA
jgi:pyrophosphatase PpaX